MSLCTCRRAAVVLSCTVSLVGCGAQGGDAPSASASSRGSSSSATSLGAASSSARPNPSSTTSAAAPGASASAAPAGLAPVTAKEFCDRTVKLGEKNLGGAPISDQENIPGLRNVRPLRKVASECSLRVDSPNVEFHGDVAARCLEAAEKCGGNTTLYAYEFIPECRGVLTGKVAEGQVAQFGEACAAGLSYVKGRCVKPVVKNAECDEAPGGMLGDPKDHPRCEAGAECIQLGFGSDGNPLVFKCLASQAIGDACKLDLNACTSGTSCYQGKCRAKAALGGECMAEADCGAGLGCDIKGGVFGKCIERRSSIHSCDPPKP